MGSYVIVAYKLVRVRKDGGLRSLFVDRRRPLYRGRWLKAETALSPKDLRRRPGWHATATPEMPHLSRKGRMVVKVLLRGNVQTWNRPAAQGGQWYTAEEMMIV